LLQAHTIARTRFLAFLFALLLSLSGCGDGVDSKAPASPANTTVVIVSLTGTQENPAVTTDAAGAGSVGLNPDSGAITGLFTTTGVVATAAHIHSGFAGENGDVLIALFQSADGGWGIPANSVLGAENVQRFNNGGLYINVHSDAYPAGEIRGQLLPEGITVIQTTLSGDNEVPPVESGASGTAALTVNAETLDLVLYARSIGFDDALTAHIHDGFAGSNGRPIITLDQDPDDPAIWSTADTFTEDQYTTLLAGGLYVNIHSPANPPGEIRGQLLPEGITIIPALLEGGNEVPPVDTLATGNASLTINTDTLDIVLHVRSIGLDDALTAHIHGGFAGTTGRPLITLDQDPVDPAAWSTFATFTMEQYDALLIGGLYVNIHSLANPPGEIRGQLLPTNITVIQTALSGDNEVPPVESGASGSASLTINTDTLDMVLHARSIGFDDALTAHIHDGFAGANGRPIITLQQDVTDPAAWSTSATLTTDQYETLSAGGHYVNMHSPANPPGEIRGQLLPVGISVIQTDLSGQNEVPPVASSSAGSASLTVNNMTMAVVLAAKTIDLDDAIAGHIHTGAAGTNGPVIVALAQNLVDSSNWSGSTDFTSGQYAALLAGDLYVNIHSAVNPGGEIRGQLIPP
jgi:hypothetical protein